MRITKVPVDHSPFGQTMTGFEHTLYANLHQYPWVPIMLFILAGCAILASFNMKDSPKTRFVCYLFALSVLFVSMLSIV